MKYILWQRKISVTFFLQLSNICLLPLDTDVYERAYVHARVYVLAAARASLACVPLTVLRVMLMTNTVLMRWAVPIHLIKHAIRRSNEEEIVAKTFWTRECEQLRKEQINIKIKKIMSKKIDDSQISSIIHLSNLFRVLPLPFLSYDFNCVKHAMDLMNYIFLSSYDFILIRNMNGIRGASGSTRSRGKNSATLILTSGRYFSRTVFLGKRATCGIADSNQRRAKWRLRHASHDKSRWKPMRFFLHSLLQPIPIRVCVHVSDEPARGS